MEPKLKPIVELVPEDWSKSALVVPGLKQGGIGTDVCVSSDPSKQSQGADGTQDGGLIVACKWDLLYPLSMLDGFRELQVDENSGDAVKLKATHIAPANQSTRVHVVVCRWHEAGCTQHRQEIEECQDFVYCKCFCLKWAKRGW